ncbi:hypothetical protein ABK040_001624 [Willaertia magna]
MILSEEELNKPSYDIETIWVCGKNTDEQLVIKTGRTFEEKQEQDHIYSTEVIERLTPIHEKKLFPFGDKLKWIGAGDHHTIFVTRSNVVYGAGQNSAGQLGLNHRDKINGIVRIPFFDHKHIVNIKCGAYFNFFLEEIGNKQNVYVCGKNNSYQLGLGETTEDVYPPKEIDLNFLDEDDSIEKFACGYESTLILTKKGFVFGCGNNGTGQLGGSSHQNVPYFTKSNFQLLKDEKIIDLQLGTSYALFLTNFGNVYNNQDSGCYERVAKKTSPFCMIHFGASLSFLKTSLNNLEYPGKLAAYHQTNFEKEIKIDENVSLLETLFDEEIITIGGLTGFFFITKDYKVYCTGQNGYFELGLSNQVYKPGREKKHFVRHYEMEDIIKNTIARNGNRKIIPTLVAGYSHTILYFSAEESRDYLRFFSNLERHSYCKTFLTDVTFPFI